MGELAQCVFLLDVDNTLVDNDRVLVDLRQYLNNTFGQERQERYWKIFEALREKQGYADYLGALQEYRAENINDPELILTSSYLLGYNFVPRLFPGAIDVIIKFQEWGPTVILSDGDVVFQPHKIKSSGLEQIIKGKILIYINKEKHLAQVEELYPAQHYVMVDDKLRILHSMKQIWGNKLTTVFVRQGHYAHDPAILAKYPAADLSVNVITDLLDIDLATLLSAAK